MHALNTTNSTYFLCVFDIKYLIVTAYFRQINQSTVKY